ncbi:hypothetical protein BJY04DRAFT_176228 [Aspergillus karnatakaensis]|uniref:uncharacterized protein n=1 Tax=Aspergillus karnatakaensis TaxID=1810916 RepID=UPI003CCD0C69
MLRMILISHPSGMRFCGIISQSPSCCLLMGTLTLTIHAYVLELSILPILIYGVPHYAFPLYVIMRTLASCCSQNLVLT